MDPSARRSLAMLTEEVREDRAVLLGILRRLGIPRPRMSEVLVGWAEGFARLKPNGTLVRRSPLSDVVELEALSAAVEAKRLGWVTLRELAALPRHPHDVGGLLDPNELDRLVDRAEDQREHIETLRRDAVVEVLGGAGSSRPSSDIRST
jgi:hypothetical protein